MLRTLVAALAIFAFTQPSNANSQLTQPAISDVEFWSMFNTLSEPGGSFVSENFVSNEMSFQYVIPALQKTLTPGGVYLGVGPEQNFTYIANLKPRMAFIVDIRRQNAMQHLLYKALFELSPTRGEFVARLFSRPDIANVKADAKVSEIFLVAERTARSDSMFQENVAAVRKQLTVVHKFGMSTEDIATIEYLYRVFFEAGPMINYNYRLDRPTFSPGRYPTFGTLQQATNADSVPMAFLGTEANYRAVRAMQQQNLIVPVVGDFSGPSAIRSVGDVVRKHQLKVTTFYLSNVEQYLFRSSDAPSRFYANVASLPLDSTGTFIRSVPPGVASQFGSAIGAAGFAPRFSVNSNLSVRITDSGGVRTMSITYDSAGAIHSRTVVDSGSRGAQPLDSAQARVASRIDSMFAPLTISVRPVDSTGSGRLLQAVPLPAIGRFGSLLESGLMPIREMLDAHASGQMRSYQDVIMRTRTGGWRQ